MREKIAKIIANDDGSPWHIADQILTLLREEIEKVENPNRIEKAEYMLTWTAHTAFEQCRQQILDLLEGK